MGRIKNQSRKVREIKLLGHRILAEGTIPNPGKVTAIEALE